jgi:hypothetical protein
MVRKNGPFSSPSLTVVKGADGLFREKRFHMDIPMSTRSAVFSPNLSGMEIRVVIFVCNFNSPNGRSLQNTPSSVEVSLSASRLTDRSPSFGFGDNQLQETPFHRNYRT